MSTYNHTWDSTSVDAYLRLCDTADSRLLDKVFYDLLEHDSVTADELAAESKKHTKPIKNKLRAFKKAYVALRKELRAATKNSEKY